MSKKTWERRMDEAKKKHRPKLANWSKDGFALSRSEDFEKMRQETFPVRDILGSRRVEAIRNRPEEAYFRKPFMIDRISCTDLTPKQFIEIFEEPALPCLITGVPDNEGWPAVNTWNLKGLKRFKDRFFKVGEDDDGYKIKVRMKYFREYIKHNKDDSPLYCFDTSYENDAVSKLLLTEYKIPSYFPSDLLGLVGEKRRPPYRWFLVGPQRSGTCIHVDPLGTSAWNTSLLGRKRWVLFPPTVARSIAKGLDVILKGEDDEAINYFVDLLPRIKKKYPDMLIMEFIQEAGDTVYIPGGWWHSVINIDDTIAITQNYCSPANFDVVWKKTRGGRKKMAVKWLRLLHEQYPELGRRAVELNRMDNFAMYRNPSKPPLRPDEGDIYGGLPVVAPVVVAAAVVPVVEAVEDCDESSKKSKKNKKNKRESHDEVRKEADDEEESQMDNGKKKKRKKESV